MVERCHMVDDVAFCSMLKLELSSWMDFSNQSDATRLPHLLDDQLDGPISSTSIELTNHPFKKHAK